MATTHKIFLGVSESVVVGIDSGEPLALPVARLYDDQISSFQRGMAVPQGYTSISAITLRYKRKHAGNLYLKFATSHTASTTASTPTKDETDSYTAYAGGGTDGAISNITVPAAAYNALSGMAYGDYFGIAVYRDAENVLDTYADDLQIVGFLVEFTVSSVSTSTVTAQANAIITLDEIKEYLKITLTDTTQNDFLQRWINWESDWLEGAEGINNKIVSQSIAGEITDGTGRYKLRTKYYPIVSVSLLQYLNSSDVWTDYITDFTDLTAYRLNNPLPGESDGQNSYNIELIDTYFISGTLNTKVSYYAGWSTIPSVLRTICIERIAEHWLAFKAGSRFGIESISTSQGGGSSSTRYKDMYERHQLMMKPYKRRQ